MNYGDNRWNQQFTGAFVISTIIIIKKSSYIMAMAHDYKKPSGKQLNYIIFTISDRGCIIQTNFQRLTSSLFLIIIGSSYNLFPRYLPSYDL